MYHFVSLCAFSILARSRIHHLLHDTFSTECWTHCRFLSPGRHQWRDSILRETKASIGIPYHLHSRVNGQNFPPYLPKFESSLDNSHRHQALFATPHPDHIESSRARRFPPKSQTHSRFLSHDPLLVSPWSSNFVVKMAIRKKRSLLQHVG